MGKFEDGFYKRIIILTKLIFKKMKIYLKVSSIEFYILMGLNNSPKVQDAISHFHITLSPQN